MNLWWLSNVQQGGIRAEVEHSRRRQGKEEHRNDEEGWNWQNHLTIQNIEVKFMQSHCVINLSHNTSLQYAEWIVLWLR